MQLRCEEYHNLHFRECVSCGVSYNIEADESRGAWGGMCRACSLEHFVCDSCGQIYHEDSYGDNGLCFSCQAKRDELIKKYHQGSDKDINFLPYCGEELYFGVELETENYKDKLAAAKDVLSLSEGESLFWLEEDCSLVNGFELITQPATLEYHKEHFPWGEICRTLSQHDGGAERADHAALHVHFSKSFFPPRDRDTHTLKLIYLVDKFRKELLQTAGTSDYLSQRSAQGYLYSEFRKFFCKDSLKKLSSYYDRYKAVNIHSSQDTFEVRIFRSTLDPHRIIANIELVDHLIHLALRLSVTEVKKLSWKQIVEGASMNGYTNLSNIICRKKTLRRKGSEITKGSLVHICLPRTEDTLYRRGGVRNNDVGLVVDLYDGIVCVNFPHCSEWHGRVSEVVLA